MTTTCGRRRLLRLALLLVGAGLFIYVLALLPPAEPRYQGKPLHYWLSRIHNQTLPPEEQQRTRAALTSIGTNNLPLLLKWFREEEPLDSEPVYRKAANWLLSRQRFSPYRLEYDYHPSRPSMAMWVFMDYPRVAENAIPAFTAMLADKDDTLKGKATLVLGKVGTPAIPALVPVLSSTNDITRALAAWVVGEIGTNAIHLRPAIEAMLSDKAICVRLNAALSLGKLGGKPETVVAVILQCVHEGDRDTRSYALDALSKLKDSARSAVPDLTNSLAVTTNADDRISLLTALREIDPEQAARFDPPRPPEVQTPDSEAPGTNADQSTTISTQFGDRSL